MTSVLDGCEGLVSRSGFLIAMVVDLHCKAKRKFHTSKERNFGLATC
jgi:hypothetical protein